MKLLKKGLENASFQKKIILVCMLTISLIVLTGCESMNTSQQETVATEEPQPEETPIETLPEEVPEELPEVVPEESEEVDLSCAVSEDCEEWKQCIDGECKVVADLYDTDCENKCNYNSVIVKTSDGETYTFNKGQGSYTGAGSLEWKLLGGPAYCPMENVPVPIELTKKTTGKTLSKEVITLRKGETSKVITHPTIKRISFTITLENLNEECT